jgi:hypothetical protein
VTDERPNEDDVLRRMLATPPEKHKPLGRESTGKRPKRTEVKDSNGR